jgi:hypothetical protein
MQIKTKRHPVAIDQKKPKELELNASNVILRNLVFLIQNCLKSNLLYGVIEHNK